MRLELIIIVLTVAFLVSGCAQTATVDFILEQKGELLGRKVFVSGEAAVSKVKCTMMACLPDNPCCNSCSGQLVLKGREELVISGDYKGKEIGCGGNECNVSCYPLEKGKVYRVYGSLKEEYGEVYLELESFEEI